MLYNEPVVSVVPPPPLFMAKLAVSEYEELKD
jgi:hypothetical protein